MINDNYLIHNQNKDISNAWNQTQNFGFNTCLEYSENKKETRKVQLISV